MRIRCTKPEFWRSHRIASVSWDARLVLKGLESYVDDNGVGKDDVELIIGDLFQRDLIREPSRTLARVSEGISELHQAGLLWRYESDGADLFYIAFWESVQRVDKPQSGRFPRPDGTMNYKDSEIRENGTNPREPSRHVAPGTGEQGNRGTGEEETSSPAAPSMPTPPGFDAFWDEYPRRVGKQDAIKAWTKAVKQVSPAALLGGALRLAQDPNREDQFTPHPATWLNAGRWEDGPLPDRTQTARTRPSTTDAGIAAIQAMKHPHRLEIA